MKPDTFSYICEKCGGLIPKERRKALPGVKTCVKHSNERAKTEDDLAEPCSVEPREVQYEENR